MRIYKQTRGVTKLGIGWERVSTCGDDGKWWWRTLHIKVDLLWWHAHFNIRYTKERSF